MVVLVNFMLQPLYPREKKSYQLNWRLVRNQSSSEYFRKDKNLLSDQDSNPGLSNPQPQHYTNNATWLSGVIIDKYKPKQSLLDNLQHQFPKTGSSQVDSEMEQVNGYTELAHYTFITCISHKECITIQCG
jgi:hypothetical protein